MTYPSTVEVCYCSRCHPTAAPNQCSGCGEEIRLGYRDGIKGFWHREAVDHATVLGHRYTADDYARQEHEYREVVRTAEDGSTYTTAEYEAKKDPDAARRKRRLAELRGEDPDYVEPIPPPEIPRHDVSLDDFTAQSGIRQIGNLVAGITRVMPNGKASKSLKHPPMAPGWELRRLTASRGPYLGADGTVLSISDMVVLGALGPEVDGGRYLAVASWRDGKFSTAYKGVLKDGVAKVDPVNADDLKSWIKEPA